ncbi:MAG: hypothetical protein KF850_32330 [Labilithrix sp.]|nr:hypothetical protein [Labilithrix sp.]
MKVPLSRLAWALALVGVVAALVATLGFVAATLPTRVPYWGEAEVLFEASRLRHHLPLWIDPYAGAEEYGAPPSRFYVTYPPLWTWVVSLVPSRAATTFARGACTLAWLGTLAGLAATAKREVRREAALAAAFVGGTWVLANFATTGRPDAIACALAAVALTRITRRGGADLLSIALLVLVPWVKPTVIGLPAGALLGACLVDRARAPRTLAAAIGLAVASAALAHVASGGAIFAHVVRSNAQPLSLGVWLEQVPSRLPFFAPLLGWAAWVGWRDRRAASARIGLAALVGAVLWTLFALAKTGSASNYWMEPAVAAVSLIARSKAGPVRVGGANVAHAVAALACVAWAGVASVRGALEHARSYRDDAAFVSALRARAGVEGGAVVAADEAGIELALNGRILAPTYQMAHLARRGAYPAATWIADLTSPATRAFVEHTGQLRLVPEVQRALEAHYVVAFEERGFRVWTPKRAGAP